MALCNAQGYPTKSVHGKCLDPGGHVWTDVFVPVENGDYALFPVDPALQYFGELSCNNHLFFEKTPRFKWWPLGFHTTYTMTLEKF